MKGNSRQNEDLFIFGNQLGGFAGLFPAPQPRGGAACITPANPRLRFNESQAATMAFSIPLLLLDRRA
jgi:hypothetical protein